MDAKTNGGHLMAPGLSYSRMATSGSEFFRQIDACGGWPIGYKYAGFEHSDKRDAGFCNSPVCTGWWTVVASADDYYMWKLSPAAMQRIVDAVIGSIRLSRPIGSMLSIKSSRGHPAELAKDGAE